MTDWKNALIRPDATIQAALEIIDKSALQIALVVDENERMLGTLTDGDIRRGLLKGISLKGHVQSVYNDCPITGFVEDDILTIHKIMQKKFVRQLPILDREGKIVRLELMKEFLKKPERETTVVLMAGGLGNRLKPLTETCPKPLLQVGNKPILETTLKNFIEHGFKRFYISVNYKANMIEEYFDDGSRWGVSIEYLREKKRMGTAGSLSLIPKRPTDPLIVMNGDLVTNVNFTHLLDFHSENNTLATVCVTEYDFRIPYGVVSVENNRLIGLEEKPLERFFVNAGIYVLEPETLGLIPKNKFFDMTSLLEKLIGRENQVAVFPIREYWLDIGHIEDFQRANGDIVF